MKQQYIFSSMNLTRTPNNPWNGTIETRYTRPKDRFESDLADEEWAFVGPCLPPPAKRGRLVRPTFERRSTRYTACSTPDASGGHFFPVFRRLLRLRTFVFQPRYCVPAVGLGQGRRRGGAWRLELTAISTRGAATGSSVG